jgi:hypothetical protein
MDRMDAIKDGAQASRHQSHQDRRQRRRTSARRPQKWSNKYQKIRVAFYYQ